MSHYALSTPLARQRCLDAIKNAPDGYVVKIREPGRTLDQNAMQWPILERFAEQLEWPVNGRMVKLSAEDWKDLLTAAYKRESQRVAMGLDGGMVMLGLRTSKMGKREFAEYMDFVLATAAQRGVDVEIRE